MLGKYRQNRHEEWDNRPQKAQKSPQKMLPERYRNIHHGAGQENSTSLRNIDLNRNLPKGKPLISPKISAQTDRRHNQKNQPKGVLQQKCTNHPAKKAEFSLDSEQGEQYFCGRCAAQLATQGCQVRRLQSSGSMKASKRPQLPCYPQFQGQPIYEDILSILRLCGSSIDNHSLNMQRFSSLQEEYQQQIDLTSSFYDRLVEIVAQMKADHLEDLALERDKYVQIAEIQNDHLRENIIEINVIRNDIQNHLEEVLEGILQSGNTKQCRESLEHYRQKLTLFAHQLEEQQDSLKNLTRYSQTRLGSMVEQFQDFLQRLWQEQPNNLDKPQSLPITVKNIHQILPRGINNDQPSKKPFRNLQEEEDEPLQERKSPNFKKI